MTMMGAIDFSILTRIRVDFGYLSAVELYYPNMGNIGDEIMPSCTFFGHRDAPESIRPQLHAALLNLISRKGIDTFYVGNQGHFDSMVLSELRSICQTCPGVQYAVVLAYLPGDSLPHGLDEIPTMFPEGLESVPRRYAISRRNEWMVRHSDYVVTYITHNWGGASKFRDMAAKSGKVIVEL